MKKHLWPLKVKHSGCINLVFSFCFDPSKSREVKHDTCLWVKNGYPLILTHTHMSMFPMRRGGFNSGAAAARAAWRLSLSLLAALGLAGLRRSEQTSGTQLAALGEASLGRQLTPRS